MDLISDFTMNVVNKSMDGLTRRQLVISSNLANVDTPGYKRKEVMFEGALQQAIMTHRGQQVQIIDNDHELPMTTSDARHVSNGSMNLTLDQVNAEIVENKTEYRNDSNSVDIERDMSLLAKNTEHYLALANVQGRMVRQMRSVITNNGG
jgi:flagellar basal-body rod protein FlgB